MKKAGVLMLALALALTINFPPAGGQTILKKVIKKRYGLRTVSCYACHQKGKKKKTKEDLVPFGEVIAKLLAGKHVTERLNKAKEAGSAARRKVELEVGKEFMEVLDKLDGMKAPSGKTYREAILAGEIDGLKPRK